MRQACELLGITLRFRLVATLKRSKRPVAHRTANAPERFFSRAIAGIGLENLPIQAHGIVARRLEQAAIQLQLACRLEHLGHFLGHRRRWTHGDGFLEGGALCGCAITGIGDGF